MKRHSKRIGLICKDISKGSKVRVTLKLIEEIFTAQSFELIFRQQITNQLVELMGHGLSLSI
jgi:hypothetical protein